MKAAYIRRYGGPDVVEIGELPTPPLGPNEVLVQVKAASVNPVDFKIRDGATKLILPYSFPLILGNDCAGVVVQIGSAVTRFKVGDEIFARLPKKRIGTFAQYAAIAENAVAMKPKKLTFDQAASIPLVGLTSWQALRDIAQLQAGQRVLIHAGSGGVGTFAIQLAKTLGATVATTASERNIALVRRLGADLVADYHKQRFEDVVGDCDVVFDTLGGETQRRSFSVLKPGGVLVSIVAPPTPKFGREFGLNPLLRTAFWFMSYSARSHARGRGARYEFLFMRESGEQLAQIGALIDTGKIEPVIDRLFPLEQTKEALAYSESGRAVGKVIVEP